MKVLDPAWSSAKAHVAELEKLRDAQMQLQMRGITADASAAQFALLTAKMSPKDVSALKKSFPRQGFVEEIEALEGEGKHFAAELGSKQAAAPSASWKLLLSARPEAVLWVAYSTKNAALQTKFKNFYTEWPQARQKIPFTQMQEMRIVPGVAGFDDLVEKVFFELMDGKLGTVEEMKAFLEPYSPPAPPPPVHLRRARATKKDAKAKARKKAESDEANGEEAEGSEETAATVGVDDSAVAEAPAKAVVEKTRVAPSKQVEVKAAVSAKAAAQLKPVAAGKGVVVAKAATKPVAKKAVAAKPAVKKMPPAKPVAKKAAAAKKPLAKKVVAKPAAKKVVVKKAPLKAPAKGSVKAGAKTASKVAAKASGKSAAKGSKKAPVKVHAKKKR
jgi:tRNA nucleotidyltransferase (CCA-adding enzyme)